MILSLAKLSHIQRLVSMCVNVVERLCVCVCVWVGAFSSTSVSLHIHFHCKFYQHPICAAVCVYVRDTEQIIRNTVTA